MESFHDMMLSRFLKLSSTLTMRTYHLSKLLGLTTTVAVCAPLSVQAASFNFDQLPNISSRPIESDYRLSFLGNTSENQGYTAFSNLDPSAPDFAHRDISLNASGNGALYYVTGRQGSPEEPPISATRSATVTEIAGFPALSSYLTSNEIPLDKIGFGFSQKSDRSFTETWNLGDDILGQDWFASPDSPIEERIYTANPDDVELFLSYGTTKIVNFGYSDIYSVLDYGSTTSVNDDIDSAFTDPTTITKVAGLEPSADALANAFLQDVAAGGGEVQLVIQDSEVNDTNFTTGNGFGIINFQLQGSIRAVPEPSSALGIFALGALGAVSYLKRQNE